MMQIDYYGLPGHMQDAMRLYVEQGIPPGSFLTAVLANDLMGALGRADDINLNALPAYGRFLYNRAPRWCFGSPERVRAWINGGGLKGGADTEEDA